MAKILRCYRCGYELSDREQVNLAYDGLAAWHAAARTRGLKPRGVLPCKNYMRCGGEIVEVVWWREWLRKAFNRSSAFPKGDQVDG